MARVKQILSRTLEPEITLGWTGEWTGNGGCDLRTLGKAAEMTLLSVTREIAIAAPAMAVWEVTEDVLEWPQWTPTVTSTRQVRGTRFETGSRYAVKQPLQREAEWEVTNLERGRMFTWEKRGSFMRLCATHELRENRGKTVNRLTIEADGFVVFLLRPILVATFSHALVTENAALKRFCETRCQTLQEERRHVDKDAADGMTDG